MQILLLFGAVLALVMIDIPIAIALGVVAVVALVTTQGTAMLPNVAITIYNGATSFPLIAIPLFILSGAIMNASGISRRLIAFASAISGVDPRRARHRLDRHVDVLRRDLGVGGGRRRGAGCDPHPCDEEPWL